MPLAARVVLFIFMISIAINFISGSSTAASYVLQVFIFLLSCSAVTARNFLEVNVTEKYYRDYLWIMGFKFGEAIKFNSIEKLFVNKVNLVANVTAYAPTVLPVTEFRDSVYKCFLKFDDGAKILLDSDKDKDVLIERLKGYNQILGTTIFDTSTREIKIIE